jgi:hypothetical protein
VVQLTAAIAAKKSLVECLPQKDQYLIQHQNNRPALKSQRHDLGCSKLSNQQMSNLLYIDPRLFCQSFRFSRLLRLSITLIAGVLLLNHRVACSCCPIDSAMSKVYFTHQSPDFQISARLSLAKV